MSRKKNLVKRAELANRLHSVAIHLLRNVSRDDQKSGLTRARLSALSVIVFAGPLHPKKLADLEKVKPPTMTRLLQGLEADGLIERAPDPVDARSHLVSATSYGIKTLQEARVRRIAHLSDRLLSVAKDEAVTLEKAAEILSDLFLPHQPPTLTTN